MLRATRPDSHRPHLEAPWGPLPRHLHCCAPTAGGRVGGPRAPSRCPLAARHSSGHTINLTVSYNPSQDPQERRGGSAPTVLRGLSSEPPASLALGTGPRAARADRPGRRPPTPGDWGAGCCRLPRFCPVTYQPGCGNRYTARVEISKTFNYKRREGVATATLTCAASQLLKLVCDTLTPRGRFGGESELCPWPHSRFQTRDFLQLRKTLRSQDEAACPRRADAGEPWAKDRPGPVSQAVFAPVPRGPRLPTVRCDRCCTVRLPGRTHHA